MKIVCRTATVLFLLCATSLSASEVLQSADGARRITVNGNEVIYQSGNGSITIQMAEGRMKIGAFELRLDQAASQHGGRRFHLTVKNGKTTKVAEVEIASDNSTIDSANIDDFDATVLAFDRSADGQLLQEARTLINENLPGFKTSTVDAASAAIGAKRDHDMILRGENLDTDRNEEDGVVHSMFDGWTCTGNVLNGIAAGAAAIAGCATPSCGAAWRLCCGGGIAWYGSALIGIAQNCNVYY